MQSATLKHPISSHYIEDPYLPAMVIIGEERDSVHFIGYYRDDCGLIELQTARDDETVCQVTVTVCDWFEIRNGNLPIPEAAVDLLVAGKSRRIETNNLFITIYDDGFDICLTDKIPIRYVRSGDVILGVAADGEVCRVLLANLMATEVQHTKDLLQEDWNGRRADSNEA